MIEKTIENFFAAIRDLNADKFVANFAEKAEITDPVGSTTQKGQAAIKAHFIEICGSFKKIDLRADRHFICGQEAAILFKGTGIGKNGKTVNLDGIDVIECDQSGKIIRLKGYWHPAAAVKSLS